MGDWMVSANLLANMIARNNIKYFTLDEIMHGWNIPPTLVPNIEYTLMLEEYMRRDLGFPIVLTSIYRPNWYNRLVGGVKNSMHIKFNAIDSMPENGSRKQLKIMHEWIAENRGIVGVNTGIGYYETFLHIDTRGIFGKKKATWGKRL